MATKASKPKRKKQKRNLPKGTVHVQATFNNTIVSITDDSGNVVAWKSSGSAGFKGSRKSTPYAAQIAAEKAIERAKDFGLAKVDVIIKGIGSGRESAVRALMASGISISSIKDVTGIPHNGCRPRKARRI
ncbi:30S ribosomal protein S11 [Candidatus Saccharibacteria bacterium]|nr:30S ribosomal protein S11 [Candidatus Saccharibacteria bacterium]